MQPYIAVSYTHLDVYKRQAQHTKNGDGRHSVAINLNLGDGIRVGSNYDQPQKIRLPAVAAIAHGCIARLVNPHEQNGGEICLPPVSNAIDFNGFSISISLCMVSTRFRPGIAVFQPSPAAIRQQQKHRQPNQQRHAFQLRSPAHVPLIRFAFQALAPSKLPPTPSAREPCSTVYPLSIRPWPSGLGQAYRKIIVPPRLAIPTRLHSPSCQRFAILDVTI